MIIFMYMYYALFTCISENSVLVLHDIMMVFHVKTFWFLKDPIITLQRKLWCEIFFNFPVIFFSLLGVYLLRQASPKCWNVKIFCVWKKAKPWLWKLDRPEFKHWKDFIERKLLHKLFLFFLNDVDDINVEYGDNENDCDDTIAGPLLPSHLLLLSSNSPCKWKVKWKKHHLSKCFLTNSPLQVLVAMACWLTVLAAYWALGRRSRIEVSFPQISNVTILPSCSAI